MLSFPKRPDPLFTAIIHDAFEDIREHLVSSDSDPDEAEDYWHAQRPRAARYFPVSLAASSVDQLLKAVSDNHVYQISDYLWPLFYDCLRTYCIVHNDSRKGEPKKVLPVGAYDIGAIDFNKILDSYFWDVDFLLGEEDLARIGREWRQEIDVNDEAVGASLGFVPHPDELRIEHVIPESWGDQPHIPLLRGRRFPRYPPKRNFSGEFVRLTGEPASSWSGGETRKHGSKSGAQHVSLHVTPCRSDSPPDFT